MNYTTIEQSKKLIEAGLDPKTADIVLAPETHMTNEFMLVTPYIGYSKEDNLIPIWSLGALIELMPQTNSYETFIDIVHNRVVFAPCDDDIIVEEGKNANYVDADTLIDALVSMTLWLLENNYIKKGKTK